MRNRVNSWDEKEKFMVHSMRNPTKNRPHVKTDILISHWTTT